jgi:DNA-binding response OmpR family regulator
MKRILVADVPQMDARYTAALRGWEIEFVRTLGAARQALGGARYDLIAIGVYFDDSQMFDLVRSLRAAERTAALPILCVRGRPGFTAVSTSTLETALRALGADRFIDLLESAGVEAEAALREAAERLVRD